MQQVKKVVLIKASPKIGEPSSSEFLASLQEARMQEAGLSVTMLDVRQCLTKKTTLDAFQTMLEADALVLTFPLYFFCLPGMLARFLLDYCQFRLQHQDQAGHPRIYAVVNCGFPEANINEEAVRVVKSFAGKIEADFRFGVMVGGGGMLLGAREVPIMKKTLATLNDAFRIMADDIVRDQREPLDNVTIEMNCPRRLYLFMGNRGWPIEARKNGLKKKDLYRRPYRRG